MGRVLERFWEVFGRVWEPFGRSGGLPRLFCSCFGTFLGCLGIFSMLLADFWLFLLFLVTLGCCGMFLLSVTCWAWFFCVLLLRGASEASEQSERAKLSGACSGFPLLTHAFAGVPLLCLAFSCFASLRVIWHFLLNGTLALPHSLSLLFPAVPCLLMVSLVLPCAKDS